MCKEGHIYYKDNTYQCCTYENGEQNQIPWELSPVEVNKDQCFNT